MIRRLLLLLVFSIAAATPAAQQGPTTRVALASVVDSTEQPLVDIGPDDFVVEESGQEREVFNTHIADHPIAILIDTGEAAAPSFDVVRKAAARFVTRLGERPIAVITLANPPRLLASFDDEREQVIERVERLEARAPAQTWLLEGAALAADAIRAAQSPFSTVVVISATASDETPAGGRDRLAAVIESGAIVHVVAHRPAGSGTPAARAAEPLRTMAEQTRGQFTVVYSAPSIQIALDRLADRLASEMMIEYIVPAGAPPGDVKIGIRVPGAKLRGLGVTPR